MQKNYTKKSYQDNGNKMTQQKLAKKTKKEKNKN